MKKPYWQNSRRFVMTGKLKDKYCIVGVGETEFSKNSGRSTRALATEAVRNAMNDAGLNPDQIDGMLSYHGGDSTTSTSVMYDLGMRLNFYMDCSGGGSSTEALIGIAVGAIEAGMCETVAIFRAMNGYSQVRIGGTGAKASTLVSGPDIMKRSYGLISAVQSFAFTFTRHMMEYGVTGEDLAHIKVAHSNHASNNPKAIMKNRVTIDDVLNSRWIVKPVAHLLDCCVETDNSTCIIVTSAERAKDMKQQPAYIMAVQGRGTKPGGEYHYQKGPISTVAGHYIGPRLFDLAGVTHDDIDVTGCYDAFTYTTLLQFEDYGFCKKGEGKDYVRSGAINLGGRRPNNTSGGHLCEGYTHGMNMVIENVRQLRGQVDDYCPEWREGKHSHDYSEGKCRQVPDVNITMNMGWAMPAVGSALIMRR
jgi:acetyl-CoA acetyltransferase